MMHQADNKSQPDRRLYLENRGKFPLEELMNYGNQWVAWSADGSTIIAHHEDLLEVGRRIKEAGIDSTNVVLELIPAEGEVTLL